MNRLSEAPLNKDSLSSIGAESRLLKRILDIGIEGNYLLNKRCRGKDIILSPLFFGDNPDIYADLVAKSGSRRVKEAIDLIRGSQGLPLSVIENQKLIGNTTLTNEDVNLYKSLAFDGVIKPPSIKTEHSGTNYFMFTPSPYTTINPTKREIYERAMALASAARQGQFLPREYAIRSPYWLLCSLRDKGYIRSNTEAFEQYKQLTFMRVGRLEQVSASWYRFCLIESPENHEALDMAIDLLDTGYTRGMEINELARIALTKDQAYIESIISAQNLREQNTIKLCEEDENDLMNIFLGGVCDYQR